jgi:hypothetical protein
MDFQFATLDPRRTTEALQHNDAILAQPTLGIEVTVPALAARCALGNYDPQHTEGKTDRAAIQDLTSATLPPLGAMLATIRPDLDSIGGMAVLELRSRGILSADSTANHSEITARIDLIAKADSFSNGPWPGKSSLPTSEHPWAECGAATDIAALAAMAAFVSDHKVPLAQRVEGMCEFLRSGVEPPEYRARVERERQALVTALDRGDLHIESDGYIAMVTSTHIGGTALGYTQAPVLVIENPSFQFQGGEPHRKVTICQYRSGYVDLNGVAKELSEKEAGWGGSPTIIGSPQGSATRIGMSELVEIMKRHSAQGSV